MHAVCLYVTCLPQPSLGLCHLTAVCLAMRATSLTRVRALQAMEDVMKTECNESQMKALVAGLDHSPVVLIQVLSRHHPRLLSTQTLD